MRTSTVITAALILLVMDMAQCLQLQPVSKSEQANWVRYVVPLSKKITFSGKVIVPKGRIKINAPVVDDMVVGQAVKELTETLGGNAATDPVFTVSLLIGGEEAKPLNSLKNSSQAYRIFPVVTGELKLAAQAPAGLYYAAKTLQQLVKGKAKGDQLEMPIVTILDWPDMEERGLWGSDNYDHLKWMGDRKMNMVEQISDIGINPDGTFFAKLKEGREPIINEGPYYAIKPVPVVLHLEQSGHRVIAAFPDVKGKSEHNGVMCYSNPLTIRVIANWIAELALLPNVTDVDVWMAENLQGHKGCQCEKCVKTGVDPMVLEARAIVKAWRMAEKITGKPIGIRILTSEATEDYNQIIFSELPKEVKVIYYHSLLTYATGRQPMLRPYLAEFAGKGRWLGVCPNISVEPVIAEPFTSAHFVRYRMKEYQDKNVSCFMGYATPRVHFSYFNVEAAAEWGWNINGRSTREFALSHAVRQGYKDPEKFADYAESVGPVLWDVYGSDWPTRANFGPVGPVDKMLKEGKLPDLGFILWDFVKSPFGNFKNKAQLDKDVELADKAVKLAHELGTEEFVQESQVAQGYIGSLKALYELKGLVKNGRISDQDKPEAEKWFKSYVKNLRQVQDALPKWEKVVRRETDPEGFYKKSVKLIQEECIDRMIKTAAELGVAIE